MEEDKKPAEQEQKAQKDVELNDLAHELTNEQQQDVQGGFGAQGYRARTRRA